MSSIGAWLVGVLTKDILGFFYKKIADFIAWRKKLSENHDQAVAEANTEVQPLKDAQNSTDGKQVSDAIKDSLTHF